MWESMSERLEDRITSTDKNKEKKSMLTMMSLCIPCSSQMIPGSKHLIRKSVHSCER